MRSLDNTTGFMSISLRDITKCTYVSYKPDVGVFSLLELFSRAYDCFFMLIIRNSVDERASGTLNNKAYYKKV